MTAPSDERPPAHITLEGHDVVAAYIEGCKRGYDMAVTEGLDVERLEVLRVAMERIEFLADGEVEELAHLALAEYARLSAEQPE
jgi:hypothetical protein